MLYAMLFLVSPLHCSHEPEPLRAVNFTREPNACYISAALQSIIALEPWREYVFTYPPHISCSYDKDIVKALQVFIREYTQLSRSTKNQINIHDFYNKTLITKVIVTHCNFDDPWVFLTNLEEKLTSQTDCSLFKPFTFTIFQGRTITEEGVSKHSESYEINHSITVGQQHLGKSIDLADALYRSFIYRKFPLPQGEKILESHLMMLPDLLWINFGQAPLFGPDWSISLPQELDLAPLCQRTQESTFYKLKSVIWRASVHYIAYVNYANTWYLCDDLKTACSIPTDAVADLLKGKIESDRWGIFYPRSCFYERIVPKQSSKTDSLTELNNALSLLSI